MTTWRALARPWLLGAALVLAFVAAPVRAQETGSETAVPTREGYVTDAAHVFDAARRAQLEGFLDQLEKKTGAEFAVLTIATTAPEAPEAYKTRAFKAWGIGKRGEDNGVLLLVAMEEHALRFETGYGLEGTLPDGWQARMLREVAVPRFRAGDPGAGVTLAVLAAAQRIAAEKGVTLEWDGRPLVYNRRGRGSSETPTWLLALVLVGLAFSFMNRLQGGGRRGHYGAGPWIGGGWGGGFGGGGGGGGSFGGFGGGGSGGGGGGANW